MQNTPLIILHGALGSKEQFEGLRELLSGDREVYTFNFPGHGGRACDEPFSIEMFAEDLLSYMNEQGIEKANLLGYSMGGYVALKLAMDHNGRVSRIMTVATKFVWDEQAAKREMAMLDVNKIEDKVPHFAEALARRHAPLDWKEVVAKTSDLIRGLGSGAAIDLNKVRFQNPVQVCVGDLDRVIKFGEAVQAARALPNGKFVPLPGGRHPIEQIDTAVLANVAKSFFDDVNPTP